MGCDEKQQQQHCVKLQELCWALQPDRKWTGIWSEVDLKPLIEERNWIQSLWLEQVG